VAFSIDICDLQFTLVIDFVIGFLGDIENTVLSKKLNAKRRALAAYITVYEFS